MTTERIDIVVAEDGSRVVTRNLEALGKTAIAVGSDVQKLNDILVNSAISMSVASTQLNKIMSEQNKTFLASALASEKFSQAQAKTEIAQNAAALASNRAALAASQLEIAQTAAADKAALSAARLEAIQSAAADASIAAQLKSDIAKQASMEKTALAAAKLEQIQIASATRQEAAQLKVIAMNEKSAIAAANEAAVQEAAKLKEIAMSEKAATSAAASLVKQEAALNKLHGAYIPAAAAANALNKAQKDADALLAAGKITQAQHVLVLSNAAKNAEALAKASEHATHASSGLTRESLVLMRELGRGDMTRFTSSLTLWSQYAGILPALMNPVALSLIAIGVAAAGVTYALNKAQGEIGAFNNILLATGNYAGLTRDSYQDMATKIGEANNKSIASVKEVMGVFISSGRFTAEEINNVTGAVYKLAKETGKTADEVAKDFAGMANDPAAFASKFQQQYQGISVAQLALVQDLQRTGDRTAALKELTKDLGDYYQNQLPQSLGTATDWFGKLRKSVSDFYHEQTEGLTDQQKLEKLHDTLDNLTRSYSKSKDEIIAFYKANPESEAGKLYAQTVSQIDALEGQQKAIHDTAAADAAKRQSDVASAEALKVLTDKFLPLTKNVTTAKQELDELHKSLDLVLKAAPDSAVGKNIKEHLGELEEAIKKKYNPEGEKQENLENKIAQQLKNEAALYGQVGEAREVQQKMNAIDLQYVDKKMALLQGPARQAILDQVQANVHANEVDKQGQAIYQTSIGYLNTYNNSREAADKLLKSGTISQLQYDEAINRATLAYNKAKDPLYDYNRNLEEQHKLNQLLPKEQEIQNQLYSAESKLLEQGATDIDKKLAALKRLLIVEQQEKELSQARNQIYDQTIGKEKQELVVMQALAQFAAVDMQHKRAAQRFFVQNHQMEMKATLESYNTAVHLAKQKQLIIDQAEKAGVISHQSAEVAKLRITLEAQQEMITAVSDGLGTIAQLQNSHNKRMSEIGKAAAIAQAIINTYQSATGAFAAMASIPIVGPFLGAAAAAAAIITGMENVNAIRSQQIPAFAFGGDMEVGGVGGTDSQLVQFMATPGEKISVSTPAQENSRGSNKGGVNNTFHFNLPNIRDSKEAKKSQAAISIAVQAAVHRSKRFS